MQIAKKGFDTQKKFRHTAHPFVNMYIEDENRNHKYINQLNSKSHLAY